MAHAIAGMIVLGIVCLGLPIFIWVTLPLEPIGRWLVGGFGVFLTGLWIDISWTTYQIEKYQIEK